MRNFLLFAAKLAISIALLYFAVRSVNFGALRERVGQFDAIWFVAAVIALGLQNGLASQRWKRIAEECDARLSTSRAMLYTFIGAFFSQVLPSTIGGDAARVWFLARDSESWKGAIFSVLVDRLIGLIWLGVFVLICLPWSLALIQNPLGRAALILIAAAAAAAPVALFALSRVGRTSFARWKIVRYLTDVSAISWTVLTTWRVGLAIATLSITIHLLTILVLWLCARAIGSPFTLLDSLLLIPPVILIATIPISIAGWGVRESAMVAAFAYAGLPGSDGLLVSIVFGASCVVIGAIGGAAWLFLRPSSVPVSPFISQ
jgi:glycosyltransferase 2 family protein